MQPFVLTHLKHLATLVSGLGKDKKLLILIYHRVLDGPDFMRPSEIDIETFSWQMELLANHFNVLPLPEAIDRLKNSGLPSRAVSITFDDGYADNYTNALPILQRYGLTATFFIASGYLDGGRMWNDTVIEALRSMRQSRLDLSEIKLGSYDIGTTGQKLLASEQIIKQIKHLDFRQRAEYSHYIGQQAPSLPADIMLTSGQLKAISASGMEIGGHTVNHPILAKLSDEQALSEMASNKQFLEQLLGKPCRFFAYPNGRLGRDYLPAQTGLPKASGFQAALSTEWGVGNKKSDLWQLPRFTPWDRSPARFAGRLAGIYLKTADN